MSRALHWSSQVAYHQELTNRRRVPTVDGLIIIADNKNCLTSLSNLSNERFLSWIAVLEFIRHQVTKRLGGEKSMK